MNNENKNIGLVARVNGGLYAGQKRLLAVAALGLAAVGSAFASSTTGGVAGFDISTQINGVADSTADFVQKHAGAVMTVAGFFIGLGLVIGLVMKFGARPIRAH